MTLHPHTFYQIGHLFHQVGLMDIFNITPEEDLRTNPEGKTVLLIGFLTEALEGNLHDPHHLDHWHKRGFMALKSKKIRL